MPAIITEDHRIDRLHRHRDRCCLQAPCRGGADTVRPLDHGVPGGRRGHRLIRYLLRFPLWGDEAMLAMNFLDRDYAGLMRPLDFHQVAPLLFLWIELTAVKLLGFHEWSLRLFPLLCSIASLFLFHRLARLLLRGTALVLAVGIFAVTYSGLRYAAEVKPYGVDLMVSTLLLLLAVRWWRQPDDTRWLWALAAVVPLALGLSYPAVFVAGGVSLAVAAVLLGSAIAARLVGLGRLQPGAGRQLSRLVPACHRGPSGGRIGRDDPHVGRRLPAARFARQPAGMAGAGPRRAAAGRAGRRRPLGKHRHDADLPRGRGSAVRQGRYRLLVLCSAPFALNLIAAAMRRFPYGGHMRLAMHLVPLVCILAGIGAAADSPVARPEPIDIPAAATGRTIPPRTLDLARRRGDRRAADAGGAIDGPRFLSAGQRAAGDPQAGFRRLVLGQHGTGP